jgi:hypothetical protein
VGLLAAYAFRHAGDREGRAAGVNFVGRISEA